MLQHVSLEVPRGQVEECVAFWALLGFARLTPPPLLRDRFTWVERAGTQIHLIPSDEPAIPVEGHVAVHVGDYEGALRALEAAGFAPEAAAEAWGAPRAFVHDPAGHRVELMAAPPVPPWPGEGHQPASRS